jgi:phosphoglycerate dehydrogenase-like enzyme
VVPASSRQDLAKALPQANALLVWDYRFASLDEFLPLAKKLSWIHAAAVGVDPLLTPGVTDGEIILTNSRGVFDTAIAEYVTGLLLQHLKGFTETTRRQQQRMWNHRLTHRLAGRKVAVVGTGSIGRSIARMLLSLNVEVTLVGRRARSADSEFGAILATDDLVNIAQASDALVLAAPLTSESRSMADRAVLDALGPQGFIINVGRGALIEEDDLTAALEAGSLGGAALDVFTKEPLTEESKFWTMENVFVSPHMSADYVGFDKDLIDLFSQNLDRWIQGLPLINVVDKSLGYVPARD